MKKGTRHFRGDDQMDAKGIPRHKSNKKKNADEMIQDVVDGCDAVDEGVEEYQRILEGRNGPQIEIMEEEEKLGNDANYAETSRFYFNKMRNGVQGAWNEVAKPIRDAKQMKKALDKQEKVVKSQMSSVRREARNALGMIALESHQEIEEMERINAYKQEQYRLAEKAKKQEMEREERKHQEQLREMKERFERERKEKKREAAEKCEVKKLSANQAETTFNPYESVSRHKTTLDYASGLNRFSIVNTFQCDEECDEPLVEQQDLVDDLNVDREMSELIDIFTRSKLIKGKEMHQIIFSNVNDSILFCSIFNRVVVPLGISEYKYTDSVSGKEGQPNFYRVFLEDKDLEIVSSFATKDEERNNKAFE